MKAERGEAGERDPPLQLVGGLEELCNLHLQDSGQRDSKCILELPRKYV